MHNIGQKLTPRQEKVIAALMETPVVSKAVRRAGVSRETYYSWVRTSDVFRAAIRRQTSEMYEYQLAQMRNLTAKAGEELARLLEHKDGRIRLGACKQILEIGARAHELLDISERLAKLEKNIPVNR